MRTTRTGLRVLGAIVLLLCADARQAYAVVITLGNRIDLSPSTFALPVEIADAVQVSEWSFGLTYDPSDVQVNVGCDPFGGDVYCAFSTGPVTEGNFFAAGAPFSLLVPGFVELDPITFAQTGHLFGAHGTFGGSPPAPSGNGILAYVQFILLGSGDSPIDVDGTVVSEPPASVPEPGTLVLLAAGLAWLGGRRFLHPSRYNSPEKTMNVLERFRSPRLSADRRRAAVACGVLASTLLGALLAPSAEAQTVAAGPYYATPAWDQTFPCTALASCPRFVVLSNFASNAVLDRETGLVWERSPSLTGVNYFLAHERCLNLDTGGRKGWRVPGLQEMMSLLDPSVSSPPLLPIGHPFTNVSAATPFYMTATLSTDRAEGVWAVNLNLGINNFFVDRRLNFVRVWCVRGGQGNPAQ